MKFKLSVLKFKQDTGASYKDTANAFGVSEPSVIANWKRTYLKEGVPSLNISRGRPPKMSTWNKGKKNHHKKKEKQNTSEIERLKKVSTYVLS